MNIADKQAAKDRVRAKISADRARPARNRLYDMLCATNTSADADALLDRAESESATADRLRAVLDICDEIERGERPSPGVAAVVLRIHRAALGDPVRESAGEDAELAECPFGLMPFGDGPVERCTVKGAHGMHATVDGRRWPSGGAS